MPQSTILNPVVPFGATVVYRGERNAKFAWFSQPRPVSTAHAERADFTPAIVIRDFGTGQGIGAEAALFAHDGALWTPLARDDGSPVGIDFFRAQVEAEYNWRRRDAFRHSNPFTRAYATVRTDVPVKTFSVPPGDRNQEGPTVVEQTRKITSSHEERARADVGRIAEAMRIVDGEVWHRCHDPFWAAPSATAALMFGPESISTSLHYSVISDTFRCDRLDELIAWRRAYRQHSQASKLPIQETRGTVEIMDGSCLTRDDLRHMMGGFKNMVDNAFAFLQRAPAPILAKWADLRDETMLLDRNWTRERAMSALESFHVVWKECESSQHVGHGYSWEDWKRIRRDWINAGRELMAIASWHEGCLAKPVDLSSEEIERIEAFKPL
jgi:hypothetical protein